MVLPGRSFFRVISRHFNKRFEINLQVLIFGSVRFLVLSGGLEASRLHRGSKSGGRGTYLHSYSASLHVDMSQKAFSWDGRKLFRLMDPPVWIERLLGRNRLVGNTHRFRFALMARSRWRVWMVDSKVTSTPSGLRAVRVLSILFLQLHGTSRQQ